MKTNFGKTLHELMKERNLNQLALSRLMGVRQSQISNWLNDKTVPGYYSIILLCQKLKVSADFLLGLEK